MIKLKLNTKYNGLFKSKTFRFEEGITVLVGPNGSGKSTLIKEINHEFKNDESVKIFNYNNLTDGRTNLGQRLMSRDISLFATVMGSSEGESIICNLGQIISNIGYYVSNNINCSSIIITMDAIDSGLSIDNIKYVNTIFDTIIQDERLKNISVYIIIAANTYDMLEDRDCLLVSSGRHRTFKTYEAFKKYILSESKKKGDVKD